MVRYEKRDYPSFGFWGEGDGSERDMRKRDFFLRSIGFSEYREYRVISITFFFWFYCFECFFFFFKCCADFITFFLIYIYINVVLTWKIVGASKASILYIYIDEFK